MENQNRIELLRSVLDDIEKDIYDEDVIGLLLEKKVSIKPGTQKDTFGQRAADKLAKFAGSWTFIIIFFIILMTWICANLYFLLNPFDPYPFILLNLVLSCTAAIQAPVIMMSQNRQEEKDRAREVNDYKVNLKTEFIIEDLYNKIEELVKDQKKMIKELQDKKEAK